MKGVFIVCFFMGVKMNNWIGGAKIKILLDWGVSIQPKHSRTFVIHNDFDFVGPDKPDNLMFPQAFIPSHFLEQHMQCASSFVRWQIQTIEENKCLFGHMTPELKERLSAVRACCASAYISRYAVRHMGGSQRVVPLLPVSFINLRELPNCLVGMRTHTESCFTKLS